MGGLLAEAAGRGAILNVQINLKSMAPSADKSSVSADLEATGIALDAAAARCRAAVLAVMNA